VAEHESLASHGLSQTLGGQTISSVGTQITALALSLTALVLLDATAGEMGLIGSLNVLPFVMFGLPAGLWVDRVRRRPALIAADVARALLLASVPVVALMSQLPARRGNCRSYDTAGRG
jgi:MFS family permease